MGPGRRPASVAVTYRPPRPAELGDCALVWYSAVDGYMARLNRPLPSPYLDPLVALLQHFLATEAGAGVQVVMGEWEAAGVAMPETPPAAPRPPPWPPRPPPPGGGAAKPPRPDSSAP